jgi:hypothetical protein
MLPKRANDFTGGRHPTDILEFVMDAGAIVIQRAAKMALIMIIIHPRTGQWKAPVVINQD